MEGLFCTLWLEAHVSLPSAVPSWDLEPAPATICKCLLVPLEMMSVSTLGVCRAYKGSVDSSDGRVLRWVPALRGCAGCVMMGEFPAQLHLTPVWCWAQMRPHRVSMQRMMSRTAAVSFSGSRRCARAKHQTTHTPGASLSVPCVPASCQGGLMWSPELHLGPFPA